MQCYYSLLPHYKNLNVDKIWLPGDRDDRYLGNPGKAKILSRDEFISEYRRAGLEPSEELLEMAGFGE